MQWSDHLYHSMLDLSGCFLSTFTLDNRICMPLLKQSEQRISSLEYRYSGITQVGKSDKTFHLCMDIETLQSVWYLWDITLYFPQIRCGWQCLYVAG